MEPTHVAFVILSRTYKLVLAAALLSLLSTESIAQWSGDPTVNTAICTETHEQNVTTANSDGAGGMLVAWEDLRNGNYDIYVQRVGATGVMVWTSDGVAVCTYAGVEQNPRVVSDGAGGAIVTWQDFHGSYDIYAQRVDASGAPQWTTDGVAICAAAGIQEYPQIVSDGGGGAIITWADKRSGTNHDVYAQRVNSSGAVQWTEDGVIISVATSDQLYPQMIADGAGGAIISWDDARSGDHIYAQRVNGSGGVQWAENGAAICATGSQYGASLCTDGASGAILAWGDPRNGSTDIYAQRVNSSGVPQWTTDGVVVCEATNEQTYPNLAADGAGGAIITWGDYRDGVSSNVYAQRVNSSGSAQWTTDGVVVCEAANEQTYPTLVADGAGGAIITWGDYRSVVSTDVYAQRVNSSGVAQWTPNGVAVSTAGGEQSYPSLVADGAGGAIMVWNDYRSDDTYDVYAEHVYADGSLPVQIASFSASVVGPNAVRLEWMTLSEVNNYGFEVQRSRTNGGFASLPNCFIPGHGTTNEPHAYAFIDSTVSAGQWWYRLKQIDLDGTVHYTDPISINTLTSAPENAIPKEFVLHQNYPNPFNPSTNIKYQIPSVGWVTLKVFDMLGREVATLVNETKQPGTYSLQFSAKGGSSDREASDLASGVYLCRLQAGNFVDIKKLILLK